MSSIALQFVLADELEVNVFASSAEAVARSQGRAALNVDLLGASVMEAQRQAMVTAPLAALPGVPIVVFGLAGVEGVAPALKLGARIDHAAGHGGSGAAEGQRADRA